MQHTKSHVPELAKARNWGVYDLAVALGVTHVTAQKLLDGNLNVYGPTLELLCRVFEVPIEKLMTVDFKNGKR